MFSKMYGLKLIFYVFNSQVQIIIGMVFSLLKPESYLLIIKSSIYTIVIIRLK